ncbi:MAG: succinate dehydrogenase, cytochrome b556 subunit [Alphaproteobacteria bacterium]|nr:succinate dehydrogenase, cytochrome b556 subunit [Alphaproteobacteria bacterium]
MNADKRPLSPHLQVYKPQLTSVLSISHRATGVALSVGTMLLVWWLFAAASGPDAFAVVQGFLGSWFGYLVLFGFSYALMYHLCNGIRHLFWDAGLGFELEIVYKSGWATVIASAALTVLTWLVALAAL